jgi:hypothetical protein
VGGACSTHGAGEKSKILVGKFEGKMPLGRPKRRGEDWITIDVEEIGRGVWIGFSWLRLCDKCRLQRPSCCA